MRVPDPDERDSSSSSSDLHQFGDRIGMCTLETQSYCLLLVAGTLEIFFKFEETEETLELTYTEGTRHEGLALVSLQHVVEESLTV